MKIAIIGFGIEGQALAQYFSAKGYEITVCDFAEKEKKTFGGRKIHYRFGPHYLDDLSGFDLIFRSPGIPYLKREFDFVRSKLTNLTKYFFENCPCAIIGVTGTKGKGTVSLLIYEILKADKQRGEVYLGGNIGQPPLEFLDKLKPDDIVVLELSSFQLQDLDRSPHIAVVLGITPDHMDYHQSMEEYIEAKKNIVRFQTRKDFAVLDFDNEISAGFAKATKAKTLGISIKKTINEGAFMKVGSFIVKRGKTGTIVGQKGQTKLLGEHNIKNILAAATVANLLSEPVENITKVIQEWRGLPHRLEFIGEINGAKFYNDSASTNPDTAIAAIRSFNSPIILIVGGSEKSADFSLLGCEIAKRKNIKKVVLMGQTKQKIERAIESACVKSPRPDSPLEIIGADSYMEAFMVAKMLAADGDTVLLSPACASFDMFKNYAERGDLFRNFVLDVD